MPPADARPERRGYVLWTATVRPDASAPSCSRDRAPAAQHRFVMIGGPDPGKRESPSTQRSIAEAAKALPNIEVSGFVPFAEAERAFNGARVVLNTSLYEGFPNTFLQAWSRGIPTVGFIDTGSRRDGEPVYDYVQDIGEAAWKLERLMRDDGLWRVRLPARQGALPRQPFDRRDHRPVRARDRRAGGRTRERGHRQPRAPRALARHRQRDRLRAAVPAADRAHARARPAELRPVPAAVARGLHADADHADVHAAQPLLLPAALRPADPARLHQPDAGVRAVRRRRIRVGDLGLGPVRAEIGHGPRHGTRAGGAALRAHVDLRLHARRAADRRGARGLAGEDDRLASRPCAR